MDKAVLRAAMSPDTLTMAFVYEVSSLETCDFGTKICFEAPTPISRWISNGQRLRTNSGCDSHSTKKIHALMAVMIMPTTSVVMMYSTMWCITAT